MSFSCKKLIRTLQSEVCFLKEAKDTLYYHGRRILVRPHDPDFAALRFIPDQLSGCYLDVGANQGQSIESIGIFKPHASIYSFEPDPSLAKKLQARYAKRDGVTVLPFGLAEVSGRRPLFVPVYNGYVYDGLASFDRNSAAGWLGPATLYRFSSRRLKLRETMCAIKRLDDFNLEPIFIKIDVQGYEYQVVSGGAETIRRCEPVLMIEGSGQPDFMRLLEELGYEQYLFDATGFYRSDASPVNTFMMTRLRASTVTRSVYKSL